MTSLAYTIIWWVAVATAVIVAIAILWLLWWWLPKWQANRLRFQIRDAKARADVEDNFRKTIGQLIGGAAVLAGAGFAYYQTLLTSRVSRDQLISQQVSKGFEQLGSDKIVTRLGGIYALEGVMNTAEQYHQPVLEALCAFVRDGTKEDKGQGPPATDIQAALTVIGRRGPGEGFINLMRAHIPKVNLSGADLSGANLRGTNLFGAYLPGAYLPAANLASANLSYADLSGANLSAFLRGANLSRANLSRANLTDANLTDADLSAANLTAANLTGAYLSGANLSGANLSAACGDDSTKLPSGMTIEKCP